MLRGSSSVPALLRVGASCLFGREVIEIAIAFDRNLYVRALLTSTSPAFVRCLCCGRPPSPYVSTAQCVPGPSALDEPFRISAARRSSSLPSFAVDSGDCAPSRPRTRPSSTRALSNASRPPPRVPGLPPASSVGGRLQPRSQFVHLWSGPPSAPASVVDGLGRLPVRALPLLWAAAFVGWGGGSVGTAPSLSRPSVHWVYPFPASAAAGRPTSSDWEASAENAPSLSAVRPLGLSHHGQTGGSATGLRSPSWPSVHWLWWRTLLLLRTAAFVSSSTPSPLLLRLGSPTRSPLGCWVARLPIGGYYSASDVDGPLLNQPF